MRKTKIIIAILIIIQFLIPSTLLSSAQSYRYLYEANALHQMDLYAGCNVSFFDPDLGSTVQRQTAVILIVKMFGAQDSATNMTVEEVEGILSGYTDTHLLASFARNYMAYAIKTGMVAGTSKITLGPTKLIDGASFGAMILKNLGYTIGPGEFIHSLERLLGGEDGMIFEEIAYLNKDTLTKDELVRILYGALRATAFNGEILIERLVSQGVISSELATAQEFIEYTLPLGAPFYEESDDVDSPSDRDIIYHLIRDALLSVSASVVLPINSASDTADEVWDILGQVLADHPEILYHSSSNYHSDGRLELYYTKTATTARSHMQLLAEKRDAVLQAIIKPDMTDYQKELAIHDYIINHCTYDLRAALPPESYSAYGVLILGTAVCEGYAEATKLLLDKAGVECLIVKGKLAVQGQNTGHAWNIVKIGGQYYHLDTTWDDPVMKNKANVLTYSYFNLSDTEIKKDHSWDAALYPVCTATAFNYYIYNNLIVKNTDVFVAFIVNQVNQGEKKITVKVSSFNDGKFNITDAIKKTVAATHKGTTYRYDELFGIIDLTFK